MNRWVLGASVAIVSVGAWGCGQQCTPEEDLNVTLEVAEAEVRTIPLLASGATTLLDTDVPDAHGQVAVNVRVDGVEALTIDSVSLTQQINGEEKEIALLRTLNGEEEFAEGQQTPRDGTFRFYWRMRELSEFALPENGSATSKVAVNWRYAGCRTQTGTAEVEVPATIRGVAAPKNFSLQMAEAGRLDPAAGPKAKMVLKSVLTSDFLVGITPKKYTVTFFSEGFPPIIGYGVAEEGDIARQRNGQPVSQLQPGQEIDVFTSSNRSIGNAPYDNAGSTASTDALVGGGKAVVTLTIESTRGTSTTGATSDVITTMVDVP